MYQEMFFYNFGDGK